MLTPPATFALAVDELDDRRLALDHVRRAEQPPVRQRLDHRHHRPHALQRHDVPGGHGDGGVGQLRRGDGPGRGVLAGGVRRKRPTLVALVLARLAVDGQLRMRHTRRPRLVLDVQLALGAGDDHIDPRASGVRSDGDGLAVRRDPVERAERVDGDGVLAVRERRERGERLGVGAGVGVLSHVTAFRLVLVLVELRERITVRPVIASGF